MRRNDLSGKKKRLRAQPSRLRPTAADAPRFDSAGPNLSSKRRVNSKGGAQRRRGESSRRETARRIQRIGNSATARADRSRPIQRGRANGGRDRRLNRVPPPRFAAAPRSMGAAGAISRGARFDLGLMARRAWLAPPEVPFAPNPPNAGRTPNRRRKTAHAADRPRGARR